MSNSQDQLYRYGNDNSIDLAVGEPYFLRKYTQKFLENYTETELFFSYPTMGGNKELVDELTHMYPGNMVCVANGAKQALLASFYALKRQRGFREVIHEAPYWSLYPSLAAASGMSFSHYFTTHGIKPEDKLVVITSPNNPDSSESGNKKTCNVWDAVYAHETYAWNQKQPNHEISVWSASKMLGISGDRVGWLVTKDKELYRYACEYIETVTTGVSVSSQRKCAAMLKYIRLNPKVAKESFKKAHRELSVNGSMFTKYIGEFSKKVKGLPETKKGMFAWFKPEHRGIFEKAIAEHNVRVLSGSACQKGLDGWYRMSLGLDSNKLEEILKKLYQSISKENPNVYSI